MTKKEIKEVRDRINKITECIRVLGFERRKLRDSILTPLKRRIPGTNKWNTLIVTDNENIVAFVRYDGKTFSLGERVTVKPFGDSRAFAIGTIIDLNCMDQEPPQAQVELDIFKEKFAVDITPKYFRHLKKVKNNAKRKRD
jgi:hypothetical protein